MNPKPTEPPPPTPHTPSIGSEDMTSGTRDHFPLRFRRKTEKKGRKVAL